MSQDGTMPQSILALDCGSRVTRAHLIHRMGGDYRFAGSSDAPTTAHAPWNDVMAGVRRAVDRLSQRTNWRLLDEEGGILSPERRDGGVDAVVAIVSAGEPLRVLLVGIMDDMSLSSARRAISATHSTIVGSVSMDGKEAGVRNDDLEAQVRLVDESTPDVVVVVGGVEGGAGWPVLQSIRAMALACAGLPAYRRPPIVYAGNSALRTAVAEAAGACTDVRFVDNVCPTLDSVSPGALYAELENVHIACQRARLPGLEELKSWSRGTLLPPGRSFGHSIEYLAHLEGVNVLGVDAGGASTTIAGVVDGRFELVTRTDPGPRRNAERLLGRVWERSVLRWLPFEVSSAEYRALVLNRSLRLDTLPQTRQDLLLEHALAREVIRNTLRDVVPRWSNGSLNGDSARLPGFQLIVGAGGTLAHAPNHAQAALTLLDAVQPEGICGLALDRAGLVAPLAGVALLNPLAAATVMEKEALLNLCTVVAPVGVADKGTVALAAQIEYPDGRTRDVEVAYGSIEVVPLPIGQEVTVELWPAEDFDAGLGTKGQSGRTKVKGGAMGIIFDARGRPLPMAGSASEQRERMQEWLASVGL